MSASRRTSLTARRRSSGSVPRLLGAVKLSSPLGAAGLDTGSPCSSSEPSSAQATPQDQSPLLSRAPAAADGLAQFSRQLTANRSADKWLDDQERVIPSTALRDASMSHHTTSVSPLGRQAVESASSQIVHKALRFITQEKAVSQPPSALAHRLGDASDKAPFDSNTLLDKGIDAISGVGKLMEGFAITLDTVIGQAFEDWGSNLQPARSGKGAAQVPGASAPRSGAVRAQPAPKRGADAAAHVGAASSGKENAGGAVRAVSKQGEPAAAQPASRQPHITNFMSKIDAASEQEVAEWRRRAQQLASELQRVREQQAEYQRLRLQYDEMHKDLQQASMAANRLAEENSSLKSRGGDPAPEVDPMAAQQVAKQMEALLLEKSKLAQENDRLLRENTGLQELLEFTVQHQSQLAGDDDLFGFGYDEDQCEGAHRHDEMSPQQSPQPGSVLSAEQGVVASVSS
ncbi:hypothetical protein D9Q98_001696 [Chlorella vulgaris]|uniref:Uncharacterized protein n=1 Tax=Chlorella vulgaris TaxID=3077 RepID=A0A9D4TV27_CHLVU|nr:hypothetical protein D9Q98_001696 [Chlorella vulgaris]